VRPSEAGDSRHFDYFAGPTLAAESIAAAFGVGLAAKTGAATTQLPTSFEGISVKVADSAGAERDAPLFFISPGQINYQVPPGTAVGAATVTVVNGAAPIARGAIQIATVAPGLFAANANGQGVVAAVALRVRQDGSQIYEPVAQFDASQNRFVAAPIDLGPATDQVVLVCFGTGIRFRSSWPAVKIGGEDAEVLFSGPQPDFTGLDQINAQLPRTSMGKGEVDVVVTVDGKMANTVKVNIK